MTERPTAENDAPDWDACPHYRGDADAECILPRGHDGTHVSAADLRVIPPDRTDDD